MLGLKSLFVSDSHLAGLKKRYQNSSNLDADLAYPALPIWTLYVSAFGAIIGANFELSIAMLFASYTDVIPSASQRASLFFVTTSMQYVGQAFFPILAGRLINLDGKGGTPEVSLYAALGTAVGTLAITFFLFPETMRKDETREETRPLMESGGDDDQQSEEPSQNIRSADVQSRSRLRHLLIKARTHSVELVSGIGSMNLLLLVISMLGASTAIKSIDMIGLVQYPVVKLSWTFSDVRPHPLPPSQSLTFCITGDIRDLHPSLRLHLQLHVRPARMHRARQHLQLVSIFNLSPHNDMASSRPNTRFDPDRHIIASMDIYLRNGNLHAWHRPAYGHAIIHFQSR